MQNREFWPLDDPPAFQGTDEEKLNKFREVRDEIDRRVQQWLALQ
jgi:arsenate reductase